MDNEQDSERVALTARIAELRQVHRDLDETIQEMESRGQTDQLRLRRLKKQKLSLKDQIDRLQSMMIPDMDA